MNKYRTDIKEICSVIICAHGDEKEHENFDRCLEVFTKRTGEQYLDDRAEYLKKELSANEELFRAFCILEGQCSGEYETKCDTCVVRKYCNSYILEQRSKEKELRMVDLFCGAGGLSLGFAQEGFSSILANDIEECCVDTYAHNHPETPRDHIILGDIREVVKELDNLIKNESVEIVIGGPPCQGFSMANRQRLIDDPRNYLYKSFIDVVQKLKPKFFVMENVKGMLGVSNQVKEDFKAIGYFVECRVFNAKDYAVPQNRERLIYIGNRLGINNKDILDSIEKSATVLPNYVLRDALIGLKPLEASRKKNTTEVDSEISGKKIDADKIMETNDYINIINEGREIPIVYNHKARYNNNRDIEIFGRLNQGDRSDDPKIADIMPYSNRNDIFKDKYFKLENDKICKTITAHMKFDCNMYIHPTQARGLTPREAARVQSYPDDYFFKGAYTKTYMQIGNSVPPLLGRAIARVLRKYM